MAHGACRQFHKWGTNYRDAHGGGAERERQGRSRIYHCGRGARESRKGGVGRGQAPRGVRRQLSEGASERADRQARSPHEWLGCHTGATCAVVGVGACSRPAAAFSRCPFSPRRPAAARSLLLVRSPRAPLARASHHRRSRYPPPF